MSYYTVTAPPGRGLGDVVDQGINPAIPPPPPPQILISSAGGPLPLAQVTPPVSYWNAMWNTSLTGFELIPGVPNALISGAVAITILLAASAFIGGFQARPAYEAAHKRRKEGKIARLRERIAELQED
jgi:hypothetical protein